MIKRDLQDGTSLFILQEDHADLAAQFAAHWGNERFAKLDPYESMVFAGIYHDSDHRETEAASDFPGSPDITRPITAMLRGDTSNG